MNPRKVASLLQFSIRGLLIAVTILCVGIAALLNANGWWEAGMWGGTLFVLAIAILLAVYRHEERRAFWLGFSVLGWLYLAVLVYSWLPSANPQAARSDPFAQSSLITTRLSQVAYNSLLPETKKQSSIPMMNGDGTAPMTVFYGTVDGQILSSPTAAQPLPVIGTPPAPPGASNTISLAFTPSGVLMSSNPNYVPIENFTHISHTLWLLLIAAIGGKVCQFIYRTRPKTES
jgi:hypothetical protein